MDNIAEALRDSFPWHVVVVVAGITAAAEMAEAGVVLLSRRADRRSGAGVMWSDARFWAAFMVALVGVAVALSFASHLVLLPADTVPTAFFGAILGATVSVAVTTVSVVYEGMYSNEAGATLGTLSKAAAARRSLAHGIIAAATAVTMMVVMV